MAEETLVEIERQLETLETAEIAGKAWNDYGAVIICDTAEEMASVANKLELLDDKSQEILLDFGNTIHKFREALKENHYSFTTKDGNAVNLVDFFSDKELCSVFVPNIDISIKEVV